MSEAIGSLLGKRYHLDAEIGWGGMAVVYRGYDTLLERHVAVKILSKTTLDLESRARLIREAQAADRLNHPNIASIHDAGVAGAVPGLPFPRVRMSTPATAMGPGRHCQAPRRLVLFHPD